MALAVIWHYWIGVALLIPAFLMLAATVVLYLYRVERPKYPTRQQR